MRARDAFLGGGAVAAGIWLAKGRPTPPLPWKVQLAVIRHKRRKHEMEALALAGALEQLEHVTEETKEAALDEFIHAMAENDLMGVWGRIFPRPHPYSAEYSGFEEE